MPLPRLVPSCVVGLQVLLAAATCATLGCAVRTGRPVASVAETPPQPAWPSRHADQASISLAPQSRGVELIDLGRSETARVFELRELPRQDGEAGGAVAVLDAPGYRTTWSFPTSDDGAQLGRARLLMVASTDVSVKSQAPPQEGVEGIEFPSDFVEYVQAVMVAVRVRPVFVLGPDPEASRGICVVTPGLGGWTDVENQFVALADLGWTVVGLTPDLLRPHRVAARKGTRGTGEKLSAQVDSELAEDAFVVEAVLRQLVRETPTLAERPLVLVGSSLGALGLPAIAARVATASVVDGTPLPRVCAAILIGGGAGLGDIMLRSALGRRWLEGAGIDVEAVDVATLRADLDAHCRFAPEHCAWALDGRPVLLIDASFDAIVPRATADRLWKALGEPQRWSYPVGHIGLFVLVGDDEWNRALEWVDAVGLDPALARPAANPPSP